MKKLVIIGVIIFIAITQIASIALHSNGIAGYTNSPGETTCNSCHVTYPLNDSGGGVTINMTSCLNNNYIAGQTYTVNVKTVKPGSYLFGFDFEALDTTGANAGTLILINTSTTIALNALVNSNTRANITHYGGVQSNDSCIFSFKWKAPNVNVGKITFYAATNASNGDGYTYGDYIYTSSQILNPDLSTIIANKKEIDNRVSVFPNPTNGNFLIETISHDKQTLQVFDINGRIVLSQNINGKTTIDATSLNDGVYNLILKGNAGVTNKKLVIVK